jgi:uncharacterized protein YkwD
MQGTSYAARASQGLEPLRNSAKLQAAAMADYAQTMARQKHYGHTGKDGSTLKTRVQHSGYSYAAGIAENIAKGYKSGKEALQGWLDSLRTVQDTTRTSWGSMSTSVWGLGRTPMGTVTCGSSCSEGQASLDW